MKRYFAFSLLTLATFACAEFDLQLQIRYGPLGNVPGNFMQAISDDANGFYAAGFFGVDAGVARFNGSGTLVASRLYDHPNGLNDNVKELHRDSSGRVVATYVASREGYDRTLRAIVQYSPTLAQNWEYLVDVGNGQSATAVLGSGEVAIASLVGNSAQVWVLSPEGQLLFTKTFSGISSVEDICDVPTPDSSRGFAVSGRKNMQGWIARFNLASNTVYDSQDSAMSGTGVGLKFIASDANGSISATGIAGGGGQSFYKVTPTGIITQNFDNLSLTPGVGETEILDSNTARSQGQAIIDFDRNSLVALRRYEATQSTTRYAQNVGGSLMAGSTENLFYEWPIAGGRLSLETTMHAYDGVTRSGGLAQFVGWNPVTMRPAISTTRTANTVEHEEVTIPSNSNRTYIDSTLGSSGDISLLCDTQEIFEGQPMPHPALLANYTASGQLKFSRALNGIFPQKVFALQDGSFAVLGNSLANNKNPSISRISAAGVLTNTRVYNFSPPSIGLFRVARIPGSADVMMLVIRQPMYNMALCRVRPDGSFVYNVSYAAGNDGCRLLELDGGNIALLHTMIEGKTAVRVLNPATGLPVATRVFTSETVKDFIDLPGPALALVTADAGTVKVRRFEEASANITHTATLTGGRTYEAVGTGPTARIGLGTRVGNDFKVTLYNGLNLAVAQPEITLPPTIKYIRDIELTNANHIYVLATEGDYPLYPIWAAKYSTTGALMKELRPPGQGQRLFTTNTAIWMTGTVSARNKGTGPFADRYSR